MGYNPNLVFNEMAYSLSEGYPIVEASGVCLQTPHQVTAYESERQLG